MHLINIGRFLVSKSKGFSMHASYTEPIYSVLKLTSSRVKSLSNVLRDLEDVISERNLTDQQNTDLKDILHGCDNFSQRPGWNLGHL